MDYASYRAQMDLVLFRMKIPKYLLYLFSMLYFFQFGLSLVGKGVIKGKAVSVLIYHLFNNAMHLFNVGNYVFSIVFFLLVAFCLFCVVYSSIMATKNNPFGYAVALGIVILEMIVLYLKRRAFVFWVFFIFAIVFYYGLVSLKYIHRIKKKVWG